MPHKVYRDNDSGEYFVYVGNGWYMETYDFSEGGRCYRDEDFPEGLDMVGKFTTSEIERSPGEFPTPCRFETSDGNRDDPSSAYCGYPQAHGGDHGKWMH
jgi:hypothetical protein